jgi:hypothetical protein
MSTLNVPTIYGEDTARTRKSDPLTSHAAGDRSQAAMKPTKIAVLKLIHQEGALTGEEINDLYSLRWDRHDWPIAKHDTPRKRAGELFADGYLELHGGCRDGRVFRLSAAGISAIEVSA